ncbi:MAG: ROK family protein [Gammaproteobacteria bacterium]
MVELFGGIEAGGTKFVCAVGTASGKIDKRVTIPTTTPEETIPQVIKYFKDIHFNTPLSAVGIASFGPVDPDPISPHFGHITSTPKLAWTNYNILGAVKDAFGVPVGFDTDVNGAALGEYRWGEAQGLNTFIYMTVGTGIGAGGMVSGKMIHGLIHPEMGHMRIPHDKDKDPFEGVCPFHGDCLEGLATGPAMMKRWKVAEALDLPADHEGWELEADYLAAALTNCILVLSPQKIIIGGGVMKQPNLLSKIHPKVIALLNGYINHSAILEDIEEYIVLPGLGGDAGICGAIALAEKEFKNSLIASS